MPEAQNRQSNYNSCWHSRWPAPVSEATPPLELRNWSLTLVRWEVRVRGKVLLLLGKCVVWSYHSKFSCGLKSTAETTDLSGYTNMFATLITIYIGDEILRWAPKKFQIPGVELSECYRTLRTPCAFSSFVCPHVKVRAKNKQNYYKNHIDWHIDWLIWAYRHKIEL